MVACSMGHNINMSYGVPCWSTFPVQGKGKSTHLTGVLQHLKFRYVSICVLQSIHHVFNLDLVARHLQCFGVGDQLFALDFWMFCPCFLQLLLCIFHHVSQFCFYMFLFCLSLSSCHCRRCCCCCCCCCCGSVVVAVVLKVLTSWDHSARDRAPESPEHQIRETKQTNTSKIIKSNTQIQIAAHSRLSRLKKICGSIGPRSPLWPRLFSA